MNTTCDPKLRPRHRCTECGRKTRAAQRVCIQCRPAPAVTRDGGCVHVEGLLGPLSTHAALVLAHALADAVSL